ncbi:MAG: ACT domain-containing protein [Cyclobacteriaceae bacterium]
MEAEKNIELLKRNMEPSLQDGQYVFATLVKPEDFIMSKGVAMIQEEEGITLVLPKMVADHHDIAYDFIASWITLKVHSSLESVGLTALFSTALANHDISCNVIAGYFHDHLFVRYDERDQAMKVLNEIAKAG